MKRKNRIILLILLCVVSVAWFGWIIKCEILTQKYGKQFENVGQLTTMVDWSDKYKVLEYSDDYACVYYLQIQKSDDSHLSSSICNTVTFRFTDGEWKESSWDSWWWDDKLIWPYIQDSLWGKLYLIGVAMLTLSLGISLLLTKKKPKTSKQD